MTPQIVAHRGSNGDEPEHSLAAYVRAIAEGADAVECDVRLTRDGTLVCVHDRRIDRTSTGEGLVSSMSLQQMLIHDYDGDRYAWADLESPPLDPTRTTLLTLRTLLTAILERSPTMGFAIETKHPTRYGGYVELELVDMLRAFGLAQPRDRLTARARVMSFSAGALRRMERLAPAVPRVFLMDRIWPWRRDGSLPAHADAAGISIEALEADPDYVARVHARGAQVHVWTVDTIEQARLCAQVGVDAIISNRPAMARAALLPSA